MNLKKVADTAASIFCSITGGILEQGANNILRNSKDEAEKNKASEAKAFAKELKKIKRANDLFD